MCSVSESIAAVVLSCFSQCLPIVLRVWACVPCIASSTLVAHITVHCLKYFTNASHVWAQKFGYVFSRMFSVQIEMSGCHMKAHLQWVIDYTIFVLIRFASEMLGETKWLLTHSSNTVAQSLNLFCWWDWFIGLFYVLVFYNSVLCMLCCMPDLLWLCKACLLCHCLQ